MLMCVKKKKMKKMMSLNDKIVAAVLLLLMIGIGMGTGSPAKITSSNRKTWPPMKNYDIWEEQNGKQVEQRKQQQNTEIDDEIQISPKNIFTRRNKVLNFLTVPNEDECVSSDGLRSGLCLNVYECRIQGGKSSGDCALGFGVCCVFTATCNDEIKNNITYFVSPNFPSLMPRDMTSCSVKIMPVSEDVSQLRFDFVHFTLGQPNRKTGYCDGDVLRLGGGTQEDFLLCGQNTGQHLYYDVNPKSRDGIIEMIMNFTTNNLFSSRLWEVRISQVPFSQRAPAGCLQYFTEPEGLFSTFNFAENGRHLANQNYKTCFKQLTGMCSIAYEPCNDQSFRIGPSETPSLDSGAATGGLLDSGLGSGGSGGLNGGLDVGPGPVAADDLIPVGSENDEVIADPPPIDDPVLADEDVIEGSGGGGGGFLPSFNSIRELFFSFRKMRARESRQLYSTCTDRITMPCIIEDFIGVGMGDVPSCVPVHCGLSLCAPGVSPCRLESSVTPFRLGIRFGQGLGKGSPEDNIGVCLRYSQQSCVR